MQKIKQLNRFTGAIPLMVWIIVFVFPFLLRIIVFPGELHNLSIQNLFFSNLLLMGLFYLHTYLIYPVKDKKHGKWWYALLLLTCLFAFTIIQRRLIPFSPRFHQQAMPPQKIDGMIPLPFFTMFPFVLVICGSFCYRLYLDKIRQNDFIKELETIQLKTELDFLRSQISPHFMFNLMNTLVSMARKKSELMEPSLINLSQLMRYMLYDSDGNQISLEEEIEYLKNYINLQLLRFGDDLRFNLFLSGRFEGFKIEPLLLMPFVENAFKHGIGAVKEPIIDVAIKINEDKRRLHMMVVNNVSLGEYIKDKDSGIGLTNVRRRLQLLYPDNHLITIEQTEAVFTVNLEISL